MFCRISISADRGETSAPSSQGSGMKMHWVWGNTVGNEAGERSRDVDRPHLGA